MRNNISTLTCKLMRTISAEVTIICGQGRSNRDSRRKSSTEAGQHFEMLFRYILELVIITFSKTLAESCISLSEGSLYHCLPEVQERGHMLELPPTTAEWLVPSCAGDPAAFYRILCSAVLFNHEVG